MPFDGELMECALCGARQQHDPEQVSDWRAIQFPGEEDTYYVCPEHFPEDGATREEYKQAYLEVFQDLAAVRGWSRARLCDVLLGLNLS